MKINNKKYRFLLTVICCIAGFWGLVSCSDDKNDSSLKLDKTEVSVVDGETARINVSGVSSVTLSVQNEIIATAVYSEGVITVTGHKPGETTLTVSAGNGNSAVCRIRVTQSDDELNFTGENASRVEGWLSHTVYTMATPGIITSFQKNTDAFNLVQNGWMAFGVSDPAGGNWLRASFKGDLQEGTKQAGFIVIRTGNTTETHIASQVSIRQTAGIKVWLEFKFDKRPDIRIVADAL